MVYIPFYDHGWHILKADESKIRLLGGCIEYCGAIYGDNAYKDEQSAYNYINKSGKLNYFIKSGKYADK